MGSYEGLHECARDDAGRHERYCGSGYEVGMNKLWQRRWALLEPSLIELQRRVICSRPEIMSNCQAVTMNIAPFCAFLTFGRDLCQEDEVLVSVECLKEGRLGLRCVCEVSDSFGVSIGPESRHDALSEDDNGIDRWLVALPDFLADKHLLILAHLRQLSG